MMPDKNPDVKDTGLQHASSLTLTSLSNDSRKKTAGSSSNGGNSSDHGRNWKPCYPVQAGSGAYVAPAALTRSADAGEIAAELLPQHGSVEDDPRRQLRQRTPSNRGEGQSRCSHPHVEAVCAQHRQPAMLMRGAPAASVTAFSSPRSLRAPTSSTS